jgi:hypothetical protein
MAVVVAHRWSPLMEPRWWWQGVAAAARRSSLAAPAALAPLWVRTAVLAGVRRAEVVDRIRAAAGPAVSTTRR